METRRELDDVPRHRKGRHLDELPSLARSSSEEGRNVFHVIGEVGKDERWGKCEPVEVVSTERMCTEADQRKQVEPVRRIS
jgi:hypothetical protein